MFLRQEFWDVRKRRQLHQGTWQTSRQRSKTFMESLINMTSEVLVQSRRNVEILAKC